MGLPICVETSFDTARTSTCATRMLSQIGRTLGKHSITRSDPALQPNRRFLRTDYGRVATPRCMLGHGTDWATIGLTRNTFLDLVVIGEIEAYAGPSSA